MLTVYYIFCEKHHSMLLAYYYQSAVSLSSYSICTKFLERSFKLGLVLSLHLITGQDKSGERPPVRALTKAPREQQERAVCRQASWWPPIRQPRPNTDLLVRHN